MYLKIQIYHFLLHTMHHFLLAAPIYWQLQFKSEKKGTREFYLKGIVRSKLGMFFLFQTISFGLNWRRVNFHVFLGSNRAQMLLLRGPTTNGSAPHTRRDGLPHHEGRNPPPRRGVLPFYSKCQYLGNFSAKTSCQRRISHHLRSWARTILAGRSL